jgi:hypothetical protein
VNITMILCRHTDCMQIPLRMKEKSEPVYHTY